MAELHGSVIEDMGNNGRASPPDPEVPEKATRRKFSVDDRRRILNEVDRCSSPGEIGAILRREGIYSSYLTAWRRLEKKALTAEKRGRKGASREALAKQNRQLKRKNERLEKKLKRAEIIIEAQKKLCQALEIPIPPLPQEIEEE